MNVTVREVAERGALFAVVVGATALFAWMLSAFFMPIFAAVVLAILFRPVFERILRFVPRSPAFASALTLVFAIAIVAIPIYTLGSMLAREAVDTYQVVTNDPAGYLAGTLENLPGLAPILDSVGMSVADVRTFAAEGAQAISAAVFSIATAATTGTLEFAIKSVIALYLLFFFVKDGPQVIRSITRIAPLRDEQVTALFDRFSSTVRAVVKGGLVVAGVQGLLGGVLFALVGVPHAALWGAVMAFLALIPLGGPALVWVPTALILFLSGNIGSAVAIVIGGALLVGTIDNILRPFLVGRDTEMPDALILLSVLGGLATFGPGGIVIGPVVAALFLSVWGMFSAEIR